MEFSLLPCLLTTCTTTMQPKCKLKGMDPNKLLYFKENPEDFIHKFRSENDNDHNFQEI